jgi:hypothetical protein
MLFCPRTSESHSPVPLPDPDNRSLFVAGPFRSEITSTYKKNTLFTPQSFVCPRMRLYTNANTRSSIKESEPLNNYVYFNKMVQFAGWWVNVQCCFYHFWSYQMRRRPNSPFGRGVFCDGLLAVTSRRP